MPLTQNRSAVVLALGLVLALLAGCGTSPMMGPSPTPAGQATPISYPGWPGPSTDLLPIPVATELVVGDNRFLLNIVDAHNEPLASSDRHVELRFYDLAADHEAPATSAHGTYLPTIPQLPGLYRAPVTFGRAGDWGLEVVTAEPDGTSRSGRMVFTVRPTSSTPALGAQAPATQTPTAQTPAEMATISTDRSPNPAFYRLSVDQALAEHRPFLLIFSTPAFCQTATCGPALDIVKSVAPDFEGRAEFIHVEPYELQVVNGELQPVMAEGQFVPVAAVREWGLLTEPYIFVVDADGRVSAKLEGVASAEEVRAALAEVAG